MQRIVIFESKKTVKKKSVCKNKHITKKVSTIKNFKNKISKCDLN